MKRLLKTPFVLLCAAIILVTSVRWRLLDVPLERDEGEYAYMGQLILQGVPPYAEAYNMKFPGIYFVYAVILALFGESDRGIHVALLLANIISILLMYFIGKKVASEFVGALSSSAFALLSLSWRVQSFWANAEHFVLPFALGGFLALLEATRRSPQSTLLLLSGFLFGLAAVVKQHGAFFGLGGLIYLLFSPKQQEDADRSGWILRLISFGGGVLLPLIMMIMYVLIAGVWEKFWFWTFTYARAYTSQLQIDEIPTFFLTSFLPLFRATSPLWIVAAVGLAGILLRKELRSTRMFAISFFLAGLISITPGFFFRPHYFVLLLPGISLLFGLGLECLRLLFSRLEWKPTRTIFPVAIAMIALVSPLASHADVFFRMTPFEVTRTTYGGHPFPEMKVISVYLKEWTSPEDRIAIVGNEPEVFFYTKRRSATGYMYIYSLVEPQPHAMTMMNEFIREVESSQPRVLLYTQVLPTWYRVSEKVERILNWYQHYSSASYRLRARYEWTPGRNTLRLITDPDSLRMPPTQMYYTNIHERIEAASVQ
jgi:hypothetical protein